MEYNLFGEVLRVQREYFIRGKTRPVEFRLEMLEKLHRTLQAHESDIFRALEQDLGKSPFESYMSELGMVYEELKLFRRKLKQWAAGKRVPVAMGNWPASGRIIPEPYGHVLIFSAWNYPLQLALNPVIGAVAAGNCVLLKPSEASPATSALLEKIITEAWPSELVSVVVGGPAVGEALLAQKFDLIFFTGSTKVGQEVYQAAARTLTPVVLELGGKSPCLVDADADLAVTARRIVWGKFLNAGQTCVAPDYLLVHQKVKDALLALLAKEIKQFFGEDPKTNPEYPRIINQRHCDRLAGLLAGGGKAYCGGVVDREARYVAPTLLAEVHPDAQIMHEEIFGPILPVLEFGRLEEAISFVNKREKPLALYYFGRDKAKAERVVQETSSGGMAINETITHLANPAMPFGGVGASGIGAYHGYHSFTAFSHLKPVMSKPTWPDLPLRYPPFGKGLGMLRWLLG